MCVVTKKIQNIGVCIYLYLMYVKVISEISHNEVRGLPLYINLLKLDEGDKHE